MKQSIVSMSLVWLLGITVAPCFADSNREMTDMAQHYIRQGKFDEARKLYEKLLQQNSHEPALYNNLASIYARQGKLDRAKRLLEQGIGTDEKYSVLLENLTAVNVAMARESYSKALELKLNNSPVELALLDTPVTPALEPAPQLMVAVNPPPAVEKQPAATVVEQSVTKPVVVAQEKKAAPAEVAPVEKTVEPAPVVVASVIPVVSPMTTPAASQASELSSTPVPPSAVEKPVITQQQLEKPPKPSPPADVSGAIRILNDWAAAWSAKDVKRYISFYINDYSPATSMSHRAWQTQRKQRISRPEWIEVKLTELETVASTAESVTISLLQEYRASNYNDVTRKQFVLVNTPKGWLIRAESSL